MRRCKKRIEKVEEMFHKDLEDIKKSINNE